MKDGDCAAVHNSNILRVERVDSSAHGAEPTFAGTGSFAGLAVGRTGIAVITAGMAINGTPPATRSISLIVNFVIVFVPCS